MKKNLLYFAAIALFLLLGACSNDALLGDSDKEQSAEGGRTISLIAAMPDGDENQPGTRVSLTRDDADKKIVLKWEVGDVLHLAIVNSDGVKKQIDYTLLETHILNEGKKAKFDIDLDGFVLTTTFALYGVYGGDGIDITGTNPVAILPTDAGAATSLNGEETTSLQKRKDVMLYFANTGIQASNPGVSVVFKHLGSLFNITLTNTGTIALSDLTEARLIATDGSTTEWAFNAGDGGGSFDLVTGKYQANTGTTGDFLSFAAPKSSLGVNVSMTFWGWYPPTLTSENSTATATAPWPELKLQLMNGTTSLGETVSNKTAKNAVHGKNYTFFAEWNGTALDFIDNPVYYVSEMGGLSAMLTPTEKENITKMVVRGRLNKADFDVFKKEMPNLTYLDLSDALCENDEIPEQAIGDDVTENANKTITRIILPTSITSVGRSAFRFCSELTGDLILPTGLIEVGWSAFNDCSGLDGPLGLPATLKTIGDYAFRNCSGLTDDLEIPSGLTTIGNYAFIDCNQLTGSLIIPAGVETIGRHAFNGCTGFDGTLNISVGVKTIGERAFNECANLSALTLPDGLSTIGRFAFSNCSNLSGPLNIPVGVTKIEEYTFRGCSGFTTLSLPTGLKTIDKNAFNACSGFEGDLILPNSLTSIGITAFSGCSGFTGTLEFPASLTSIPNYIFQNCTGFETLILHDAITGIGTNAFFNCSGLTGTIEIPSTVTRINSNGFMDCDAVEAFKFYSDTPITYSTNMLPPTVSIKVPALAVGVYQTSWSAYATYITAID